MGEPDTAQDAKTDVALAYKAMQPLSSESQEVTAALAVQGSGANSRCYTEFLFLQSFLRSFGNYHKLRAIFI